LSRAPIRLATGLVKLHVVWFIALPPLALASLFWIEADAAAIAFMVGWIPASVLTATMLTHYRLSTRPVRAIIVVGAVPAQVAIAVFLLGDSLAFFFIETAFVELIALHFALALSMLIYRPSGVFGAVIGCALLAATWFSFGPPVYETYSNAGLGWQITLGVVILTAIIEHLAFLLPLAGAKIGPGTSGISSRLVDLVLGEAGQTVGVPQRGWKSWPILIGLFAWGAISFLWILVRTTQ
jgi:hypothetical protein